jgi:hypothetical protein
VSGVAERVSRFWFLVSRFSRHVVSNTKWTAALGAGTGRIAGFPQFWPEKPETRDEKRAPRDTGFVIRDTRHRDT